MESSLIGHFYKFATHTPVLKNQLSEFGFQQLQYVALTCEQGPTVALTTPNSLSLSL